MMYTVMQNNKNFDIIVHKFMVSGQQLHGMRHNQSWLHRKTKEKPKNSRISST